MRASNKRRVVLYTGAALALSGLVYGGFVYRSTPDVETLISCARPQIALGLYEHAESFVRDALAQDPEHFEGLLMLAAIHEHAKQKPEAMRIYQQLLPRSEGTGMRGEIEIAIARLNFEDGRTEEALAALERAQVEGEDTQWKRGVLRVRCLHALGKTDGLEAQVHALEDLSKGTWSGAKLRAELGLPQVEAETRSMEGAESLSSVQAENESGR